MGGRGIPELLILLASVVMLFGVGRLPEVGKSLGKSMHDLRHAIKDEDERNAGE
ncbi:MAG: twin-arginine translocase TatA/TatE family subunit [Chloroflexi bacterium]|nr:twin-arginine translocase TatA/TatE family subunit [Chloroflexota bacterium]